MRIALFITCLTDAFYPRAGIAVVKVLEHLGHEVVFRRDQTCCGQPMYTGGFRDEAVDLARRTIRVFKDCETVVTPSSSCAAMLREHYLELLADFPEDLAAATALAARTYEFIEFLTRVEKFDPARAGVRWDGSATYHYPCHHRALGLRDEAIDLMRSIDGLSLTELENADHCCGFGGSFAVKYPPISGTMVREKVAEIRATGAETVVSDNAGCTMNIAGACRRAKCDARFTSLAEIIAEGLGVLEPRGGTAPR